MDAFVAYLAFEAQIILLFIGVWRKAVLATFFSALVGLELIANLALDGTIRIVSLGAAFYQPVGVLVFPVAILVIYALVAMRAEFSLAKLRQLGKPS